VSAGFEVMMVTDRRRAPALADRVAIAARAGLDLVQVREKDLSGRALLALVREVVAAAAGTATRVLVNGRPDVARAAGAHGVQLPADGLPVAAVRAAFPELLVGASCHSAADARAAAAEGASFVVVGPVFATPGKESRALGADALSAIVLAAGVPVFAIGGIDGATSAAARTAGARGVAAIRPFLGDAPGAAVDALRGGPRR
jgi:thiamine-phosphate pyrophosphorylase